MDQKFAVLSKGPNYSHEIGYNTLRQARDDGALVLAYGYGNSDLKLSILPDSNTELYRVFIETLLNFLGVSLTLYAVGHVYMFIFHNKIIKPTVRCPYCKQYISDQVSLLLDVTLS
jgi:large conductance mechanosensitive channel